MKTTKLFACYVRVSTTDQNEDSQIREIQRWLEGQGIDPKLVRWYIDKGASGDNLNRPEFERLQADIFAGLIGSVVVWKLDRLSRKIQDGLNTLCDWCDRKLRVVSVTQQIDFNGTVGKMIASVLLGVAEMEQETRRERQAVGIKAAKARGVTWGGTKPGRCKAKPARAKQLKNQGFTQEEIGKTLGIARQTVAIYLTK